MGTMGTTGTIDNSKRRFALILAGVILMSGCEKESAHMDGNAVIIESAELRLNIPEGWSAMTGKDIYKEIYPQYSDEFDSAEDMKNALEEMGERYIAYAVSEDSAALLVVTVQEMDGGTEERPDLEGLARTVHNDTLFDYLASGYRTGSNSVFELTEIGGREGWLSFFELYMSEEEEPRFELAQEMFMFELDGDVYSFQLIYSDKDSGLKIGEMLAKG